MPSYKTFSKMRSNLLQKKKRMSKKTKYISRHVEVPPVVISDERKNQIKQERVKRYKSNCQTPLAMPYECQYFDGYSLKRRMVLAWLDEKADIEWARRMYAA